MVLRCLVDVLQNVRVEGADEAGVEDANRFGLAQAQTSRKTSGPVADFLSEFEKFFSSAFADAAKLAQRVVNSGFGNTEALGYRLHVEGFLRFHQGRGV